MMVKGSKGEAFHPGKQQQHLGGYWTTRGYGKSRTVNSCTSQFHELVKSQTSQLVDWSTRGWWRQKKTALCSAD